jgi:conjugative transposon TraK protein
MFRPMKNIDAAFRQMRLFTLLVVVGSIGLSLYVIHSSYIQLRTASEKIYILANGKALEAFASDRRENIPVEARDHVRMFHHYFFTLDPDEKVIDENIMRALYLADASAKKQYDNLKEKGFFASLVSGNISQEILVDSISVSLEQYPYYFRCYARQHIIRTTSVVTRQLLTEGYLRNTSRSDNNPHGFLIEKWKTLENKDINVQNR